MLGCFVHISAACDKYDVGILIVIYRYISKATIQWDSLLLRLVVLFVNILLYTRLENTYSNIPSPGISLNFVYLV